MSTTLDEQLISQKIHNYNYAPGIATYGVDGKTGAEGESGNNIYYTDYYIKSGNASDLQGIAKQITAGYLPLKNSTISISRPYADNDYFFDNYGTIYKLKNLDDLKSTEQETLTDYQTYFSIVGKINIDDNKYVTYAADRLIINSSTYNGFDIVSSETLVSKVNTNSALNIISDSIDENNRIQLLQLNGVNSNSLEDGTALVYYDTGDNAFHLNSNIPLVIDADVKINNDVTDKEYDNYSTIMTSHDTITYFKSLCDKLTYNITIDDNGTNYMLIYAKNYESEDASGATILQELIDKSVYAKVYGENGQQSFIALDSYESNTGNLTTILDSSLAVCSDWTPDVSKYFTIVRDNNYTFNSSVNFKGISGATEYFKLSNGTQFDYKGSRKITYYGKNSSSDSTTSKMTKFAYIYNYGNTNIAIFDPMLLIPGTLNASTDYTYWPLKYWDDYVTYNGNWDESSILVKDSLDGYDLSKKTIYNPVETINSNSYVELGTSSYNCKMLYDTTSGDTSIVKTHSSILFGNKMYTKTGDYEYKFTYEEADEIQKINSDPSFGPYKHSISTDFFYIKIHAPFAITSTKLDDNIIVTNLYHLNYVRAHAISANQYSKYSEDASTAIQQYPQLIDGEEYTFKFSLYIGDDGLKLYNATLSGKLNNNATNTNIPAFKVQIPDFIGDTGKVSLMYNTEIFLS